MIVPYPSRMAFAVWPFIFLPLAHFLRFVRGTMTILDHSVLVHERVHLERERQMGVFRFGYKYFFNPTFRLEEELVAIEVQMRFLFAHGEVYDCERKAGQFAGSAYRKVLPYEEALERLQGLWRRVSALQ